jgi:hypothetical protein
VSVVDAFDAGGEIRFVGKSGQVYEPAGDARWERKAGGGVASDLLGVVRGGGKALYAIASTAPIFEWDGSVWSAHPLPNRGTVALSRGGGVPAFSVNKHIYLLKGKTWERLVSAPRRVTAVWASSATRSYAVTTEGKLLRTNGKSWATMTHPMSGSDPITELIGAAGGEPVLRSRGGALARISGNGANRLVLPADLAGFEIHAAGSLGKGKLVLAGIAGAADARRSVLVSVDGGKLAISDELWPLDSGDRFSVIAAGHPGELTVATLRGKVKVRSKDGTWRDGAISGALPSAKQFQSAAPARAR